MHLEISGNFARKCIIFHFFPHPTLNFWIRQWLTVQYIGWQDYYGLYIERARRASTEQEVKMFS